MPFRVFSLTFDPVTGTFGEDELNLFCLGKRVLAHRAEFFRLDGRAYWSVFLEYEPLVEPRPKRAEEELNPEQRALFDALRAWRREEADRQGAPVFIVANNALFSEIARRRPETMEALKSIRGFGQAKAQRYGAKVLEIVGAFAEKQGDE